MPKNSKGREIADIASEKCIGCQVCLGECPVDAINMENGVAVIDKEKCIGCGKCFDVCPSSAVIYEKPRQKKPASAPSPPGASGPGAQSATALQATAATRPYSGVAVFIEVRDGAAAEVSWELLGKARELAGKLDTNVMGFLLGEKVEAIAREAITYGCDTVYIMDNPIFHTYASRMYGNALAQLCNQIKPEVFLIGATPLGRDLSSIVATQLKAGLTADCTGLDISEEKLLLMTRPTFGGNIMATILCRTSRPQMSTVRPKVMKMPKPDPSRQGEIKPVNYTGPAELVPRILDTLRLDTSGMIDITRSPVLVVLGKGACDSKNFPMIEELTILLGGTIACSRPVVEAGVLPYLRQVGQTGKTVAPKLYIGVGVSGAVQHQVGMQGSEKVIAINVDRNAPMVQIADYSLIGDYVKIIPELIKDIKARAPQFLREGART